MADADRNAALLSSLRRLVRGLSALFWGLPVALLISFQFALGHGDWLKSFGITPMTAITALLFYGTLLLGRFQSQERIWINALERARIVALVNLGLSPFLYFWSKVPNNAFFTVMVEVMFLTLLAFLFLLNSVLARLAAMLPDETLRGEARVFTRLNQTILLMVTPLLPLYFLLRGATTLPRIIVDVMLLFDRGGTVLQMMLLMFFILLPVAMTMALLWKTKEVIMAGVFSNLPAETPPRIS
jgi:hypothetical protein